MDNLENDTLHFLSEESDRSENNRSLPPWKVIVADDDFEVHAVTELALSNFKFKGRSVQILNAYSAAETEELIQKNEDTAVLLLDVVMEHHDSGLELVRFIRQKICNNLVRIILRTGQPGDAPELEVILNYDINDYKEKTELTSSKLVTTLIASLRNFDDLEKIEQNRKSLQIVAESSATMHNLKNKDPFTNYLEESLLKILTSFSPTCSSRIQQGILKRETNGIYVELYNKKKETMKLEDVVAPSFLEDLSKEPDEEIPVLYRGNAALLHFRSSGGNEWIIYVSDLPELNDIRKSILLTFSSHITTVFNNIELMNLQIRKERDIRKSLDEKLILVKEIHHRVKNNLQIISSLLHMQADGVKDPGILELLKDSQNRVLSMSLVHEKLYQTDLMATIDFSDYISSLAERLINTYSVSSNISLVIKKEPLMLSINTAIPCGLIINEILTNSIKYAFPEHREGIIRIDMKAKGNVVTLIMSDNGIGLPEHTNPSNLNSLGMKLIRVLTDQIDGEMSLDRTNGTTYTLKFNESTEKGNMVG